MLLSFSLIFGQFQPGAAYKSVAHKKSMCNVCLFAKNRTCDRCFIDTWTFSEMFETTVAQVCVKLVLILVKFRGVVKILPNMY